MPPVDRRTPRRSRRRQLTWAGSSPRSRRRRRRAAFGQRRPERGRQVRRAGAGDDRTQSLDQRGLGAVGRGHGTTTANGRTGEPVAPTNERGATMNRKSVHTGQAELVERHGLDDVDAGLDQQHPVRRQQRVAGPRLDALERDASHSPPSPDDAPPATVHPPHRPPERPTRDRRRRPDRPTTGPTRCGRERRRRARCHRPRPRRRRDRRGVTSTPPSRATTPCSGRDVEQDPRG